MHRASLNLIQDISLESLLERIGAEACRQANARYAVVGVLNENNEMDKVISMGMDDGRIARIHNVPGGDCITAVLLRTRRRVHIENAALDPQCKDDAALQDGSEVCFVGVPVKLSDRFLGKFSWAAKWASRILQMKMSRCWNPGLMLLRRLTMPACMSNCCVASAN
jgi:GAF domain-containing protein